MSKLADFENASLKNAFNEMKETVEKHPDYKKHPEIGKIVEGLGIFTEGLAILNLKTKDRKNK